MTEAREKRIGELLIDQDIITSDQLSEALMVQARRGGRVCQVLINLGHLTEEQLLGCLGSQRGMVSVNLRLYTIDPTLIKTVPKEFALEYEVMPLDRLGSNLTVAMAVPLDMGTRRKLEDLTGLRVRAVLCSRGDVRAAIEQYYGVAPQHLLMRTSDSAPPKTSPAASADVRPRKPEEVTPGPEAVRLRNVMDILETVDQFPLLPRVHARLLGQIDEPDASVAELTEVIQQDPTLAANLLKLANSAAYAARSRFDSVQRAIAYIGLRELRSIVISSAVLQTLSEQTGLDLDRIFQASYQCGLLTKIISDTAGVGDREVAFTAGLLHNLGGIVLRYFSHERFLQIDNAVATTGRPRIEVEEEIIGIAASEIGYHLTERWNIPATLGEAIRFHDRLDSIPEPPALSVAVAFALHCLDGEARSGTFCDPDTDAICLQLLDRLGLARASLTDIEAKYRDAAGNLPALDPGA